MLGQPMSGQALPAQPPPNQVPPGQPMSGPPFPVSGGPTSGGPTSGGPFPAGQALPAPPTGPTQPVAQRPGVLRGTAQVAGAPSQPAEQYYEPEYATSGYRHAGLRSRRLGPWLVGGAAAVVAILLVVIAIGAGNGWFSGSGTPSTHPSAAADNASNSKHIRDSQFGYATSIPKTWKADKTKRYRQYSDPADNTAWIRFNVEGAQYRSAQAFLQVAANGLRRNVAYRNFTQIALRKNMKLGGRPAAELEYQLTDAKTGQLRHAIWRATLVNGVPYEVYLSVPQRRYPQDKSVYTHAVQAYTLS
jgi:hypothetical protein